MPELDFDARMLGFLLGLGDLERSPICHGYGNGCRCSECRERAKNKPPVVVRQPWEKAA